MTWKNVNKLNTIIDKKEKKIVATQSHTLLPHRPLCEWSSSDWTNWLCCFGLQSVSNLQTKMLSDAWTGFTFPFHQRPPLTSSKRCFTWGLRNTRQPSDLLTGTGKVKSKNCLGFRGGEERVHNQLGRMGVLHLQLKTKSYMQQCAIWYCFYFDYLIFVTMGGQNCDLTWNWINYPAQHLSHEEGL